MIAFYKTRQEQYSNQYPGSTFINVCPERRILPFQFVVPKEQTDITQLVLVGCKKKENVLDKMKGAGLKVINKGTYNIVFYPANVPIDVAKGTYYLQMTISGVTYYSEEFRMMSGRLTKIEFTNDFNFTEGDTEIVFEGFSFEFYTTSKLSQPKYTYEEEATQRGGYTFIESQISKKTYAMTFLATEQLCDRLRLAKLCDTKYIEDAKQYKALTLDFEPEWMDNNALASVSIEFDVDNIIARSGGYTDKQLFMRDYDNSFNQSFR